MKIIYPYNFSGSGNQGGHIHVKQFIDNIEKMGHQVITQPGNPDRIDPGLNNGLLDKIRQIRRADVIYYRLEEKSPSDRLHNKVLRNLVNNPLIVWEFNTVPEYAMLSGMCDEEISSEKKQFRKVASYCDLAICVSHELAKYVADEFMIENICCVPNGSDPTRFKRDLEPVPRIIKSPDILNVVWIGSAGIGWHDFGLLEKCADYLCQQGYGLNISFHVLGGGMRSMADLPVNISYYGIESYDGLPRWLASMDVGLVLYKDGPANYNSPLKLFDYMASGLSVVGTEQPQVKEILTEFDCDQLLVPTGDYKSLADSLVWLLQNKDKANHYGDNARKLLVEKYTWEKNAESIMKEIQKVMAGKKVN